MRHLSKNITRLTKVITLNLLRLKLQTKNAQQQEEKCQNVWNRASFPTSLIYIVLKSFVHKIARNHTQTLTQKKSGILFLLEFHLFRNSPVGQRLLTKMFQDENRRGHCLRRRNFQDVASGDVLPTNDNKFEVKFNFSIQYH